VSLPSATQDYLANGALNGNRNNALFAAACQFRDDKRSLDETVQSLLPRAIADGLSKTEALSTIGSAFKRGPRDPFGLNSLNGYGNEEKPKIYRKVHHQPVPLPNPLDDSTVQFLQAKFLRGEWVCIGEGYEKVNQKGEITVAITGGVTRTLETWIADIKQRGLDVMFPNADGLFVRVNPMKDGSGNSDRDVALYRDILVESDEGSLESQLGAIRHIELPSAATTFSGDRSVQRHFRVNATDEKTYREWFSVLRKFCLEALNLEMDEKNINPSRYSRLPGGKRIRRNHDTNERILANGNPVIVTQTLLELGTKGKPWVEWFKSIQPPPLIEFLKPSEIKAYKVPPGIVLVGDNHIVRGGISVIGGAPGVGKSRAQVALAEAGATKLDWLGLKVHCNFRTLVIQNENGRFRLSLEFADLDTDQLDKYLRITPPPPYGLCFDRQDFRSLVKDYIEEFDPAVVCLDPWNAVARDDKVKDYRETFDLVRQVVPAGDQAPHINIAAHTRKPHPNERANGRALLNLLAGSYILVSVPRTVWVFQHASDAVDEERVVVTCCKNNDGDLGSRSAWNRDNGLWTPSQPFDWSAWDNGEKPDEFTPENVVEILRKNSRGLSQAKLASEIIKRGVSKATAYRRIDTAEKKRLIKFQSGKDVYVAP
jgi:hypothetical protein